jgi:DNA repair exonuclease SbcCD ATPase subunit
MGESKKINIAIALSYLKLILKFRKLNILFLDEVFSSMEPENVEYALKILKKFSKEFNLNIIILDPKVYFTDDSNFGYNYFDRILKISKKMSFSIIEE